jgi:hypothetical protein
MIVKRNFFALSTSTTSLVRGSVLSRKAQIYAMELRHRKSPPVKKMAESFSSTAPTQRADQGNNGASAESTSEADMLLIQQ